MVDRFVFRGSIVWNRGGLGHGTIFPVATVHADPRLVQRELSCEFPIDSHLLWQIRSLN